MMIISTQLRQSGNLATYLLPLLGVVAVACMAAFSHSELSARRDMAHAHTNFTQALRITQRGLTSRTIDTQAPLPDNTGEWIALLNHNAEAPGGGPAFIVNRQGNPVTGAVGVAATNFGTEVQLTRPAYQILDEHQSVVRSLVINESF